MKIYDACTFQSKLVNLTHRSAYQIYLTGVSWIKLTCLFKTNIKGKEKKKHLCKEEQKWRAHTVH